jgi:hypothetical protein
MKRQYNAKPMKLLVIPARLERATYCLEGSSSLPLRPYSKLSITGRNFPQLIRLAWDYVGTKPTLTKLTESITPLVYRKPPRKNIGAGLCAVLFQHTNLINILNTTSRGAKGEMVQALH